MNNVPVPISIRLGARNRPVPGYPTPATGTLGTILIDGVTATPCLGTFANYGSFISGMSEYYVSNVTLRNIDIPCAGGLTNADLLYAAIPEDPTGYPNNNMFGILPAYGLYTRHASGVTFQNIDLTYVNADYRPPLVFDDVSLLNILDDGGGVYGTVNARAYAPAEWFGTNDATLNSQYDLGRQQFRIWTTGKLTPPPAPTTLVVAMTAGAPTFSWPAGTGSFSLHTTDSLASGVWNAVTNAPALSNGFWAVNVPVPTESQRFYRLQTR
jgi:hypothetical protein